MANANRRPQLIQEAADLLDRAAEKSAERSVRRNILSSLAITARRTRARIEANPEDEVIEPHSGPEPERDYDPWAVSREGGSR